MKKIALILLSLPVLMSCEKLLFEKDYKSSSPSENFEYIWEQCDEKYAYFDLKNIDWDSIKTVYQNKIYEEMTDDSLFNVIKAMLVELEDGHVNLVSDFNISFFQISHLGQDNFDWRIIQDHYLSDDVHYTGPFIHDFVANGEVGYVRFASFTGGADDEKLDFILNRYKNTKGLILDLRENGGGAVTDVFNILRRFVEEKTLVFYSRIKSGKGHDEFSAKEPAYVEPYDGIRYKNKVMVLVDRGTYSAGSFTSLATKAIPNMVLVGDTTGGGLGAPNGGQLPNGWTYRFSITQALTLDGDPSYEDGVPVDVPALFDWDDLETDEVIETAIQEILP